MLVSNNTLSELQQLRERRPYFHLLLFFTVSSSKLLLLTESNGSRKNSRAQLKCFRDSSVYRQLNFSLPWIYSTAFRKLLAFAALSYKSFQISPSVLFSLQRRPQRSWIVAPLLVPKVAANQPFKSPALSDLRVGTSSRLLKLHCNDVRSHYRICEQKQWFYTVFMHFLNFYGSYWLPISRTKLMTLTLPVSKSSWHVYARF